MTISTTLPALAAPLNALSCPPESPTSPGIGRRAVLARAAAALGLGAAANVVAVVATTPAAIAKMIPLPTRIEVPELLALEPVIDRLEREMSDATQQRVIARAAYDRIAPAVPDELRIWTKRGARLYFPLCQDCSEMERDTNGKVVLDDKGRPKRVIRAENLRRLLPDFDGRSVTAREMKRLLRIAEPHEGAIEAAQEQSGLAVAEEALAEVQSTVFDTYEQAYRLQPLTMRGLLVVARAIKLVEQGGMLSSDALLADQIIGVASRELPMRPDLSAC